ncbi:MAG: hypothetical protein OEW60_01725 [Thiovulaceae bacterium]|nr:hypothetical protein [Sulfurimonadaceae bacterium]
MKFFVSGDIKHQRKLVLAIFIVALFFILFLLSDMWVKSKLFGLTIHDVSQTLLGDEENFIEPYAFSTLLEMIHTDLFFVMMLFILSGALYFRIKKQSKRARIIMSIILLMVFVSMITPFVGLHYYLGSLLWYYSFIIWHLLFIVIYIDIIVMLSKASDD